MKEYDFQTVAAPLCRGDRFSLDAATERRGYRYWTDLADAATERRGYRCSKSERRGYRK